MSIGNLHWGGSGKTPTVIAAARGLAARTSGPCFRVAVLSRGYGRRGSAPLVVSLGSRSGRGARGATERGAGERASGTNDVESSLAMVEGAAGAAATVDAATIRAATVETAGDEPLMIVEQVPDAAVVVGADRRAAAALALSLDPTIDVFLLDDGFSHVRVRRDVEILTFPASDPFGGGLLPPGGRLREPLELVRLADAAVLTGLEAGDEPPADFEPTLHRHGFAGEVFTSSLRAEVIPADAGRTGITRADADRGPRGARRTARKGIQAEATRAAATQAAATQAEVARGTPIAAPGTSPLLRPRRPLLVTGIARPERVARTAATAGLDCVDHLFFPDHHRYPSRSLRAIEAACIRNRCDAVVVTSKDAVKLRGRLPEDAPPLLELRVEAQTDSGFLPWLAGQLDA